MIQEQRTYQITCDECGMTKTVPGVSENNALEYLKTQTEWTVVVIPGGPKTRDPDGPRFPARTKTYCPLHAPSTRLGTS